MVLSTKKRSNPIAKIVRSRTYRSQVVQSKKLYNRKEEKINALKAAAIGEDIND